MIIRRNRRRANFRQRSTIRTVALSYALVPPEHLENRWLLTHGLGYDPTVLRPSDLRSQQFEPGALAIPKTLTPSSQPALAQLPGDRPAVEDDHADHEDHSPRTNVRWTAEKEMVAPSHANDSIPTAQFLRNVGTSTGQVPETNILGSLGVAAREISVHEDDGSIPSANPTGIRAGTTQSVVARARIGDGPHGSSGTGSGDYDFYRVSARAGQLLSINVEAESLSDPRSSGGFVDMAAGIYDSQGTLLTFNDNMDVLADVYRAFGIFDFVKAHYDPGFRFQAPADGDYFVVVFSSFSFPSSPFESASGGGVYLEGEYRLSIAIESPTSSSSLGETTATDDGAIQLAIETGITAESDAFYYITGYIGDGPHGKSGTGSGDFDMYRLEATAGQRITISADTDPSLHSVAAMDSSGTFVSFGVDTKVIIYTQDGQMIWFSEDYDSFDGGAEFLAPYSGSYYVSVSGYSGGNRFIDLADYVSRNLLANPFDSSSGGIAGTEGFYQLLIRKQDKVEHDAYSVELRSGDVLSVTAWGGVGTVKLIDPSGKMLQRTYTKEDLFAADGSPTPAGVGDLSFQRIITEPGKYTVVLTESVASDDPALPYRTPTSPYDLTVRVDRPGMESQPVHTHQVLFLDFDGVDVESTFFNDYFTERDIVPGVDRLSPMRDYLEHYGLSLSDEDFMIDTILDYTVDRLATDMGAISGRGQNGEFLLTDRAGDLQIEILNSRDHADYYMVYPNVSRIIIGASFQEIFDPFGGYYGLANSIDTGNYDFDDQAVVVVDAIFHDISLLLDLGVVGIAPTKSRREFFAAALAPIIVHEAGHNLGSLHTSALDNAPQIMDSGGGILLFQNMLGLGPDFIYGSTDDVEIRFTTSSPLSPFEFPFGTDYDSLNTVAFGLSTGTKAGTYFDFVTGTLYVSGDVNDGHQDRLSVRTVGGQVEVTINGEVVLTQSSTEVQRVVLNGSDDRDELDAEGYDRPVKILGKGGDDRLGGGSGDDVLLGGPGRDRLEGRDGNDLLIGGDGHDLLSGQAGYDILIGGLGQDEMDGGSGEDLLISGSTLHDHDVAALAALRAEWTSGRSYEERIRNLNGTGLGPRANEDYYLLAGATDPTVLDDGEIDRLFGGTERDWFFASTTGPKKDLIKDLLSGELVQLLPGKPKNRSITL